MAPYLVLDINTRELTSSTRLKPEPRYLTHTNSPMKWPKNMIYQNLKFKSYFFLIWDIYFNFISSCFPNIERETLFYTNWLPMSIFISFPSILNWFVFLDILLRFKSKLGCYISTTVLLKFLECKHLSRIFRVKIFAYLGSDLTLNVLVHYNLKIESFELLQWDII